MTRTPVYPPGAACQTCLSWQRQKMPDRREAAEYLAFRPCARRRHRWFSGRMVDRDCRVLTAPDARCADYVPRPD